MIKGEIATIKPTSPIVCGAIAVNYLSAHDCYQLLQDDNDIWIQKEDIPKMIKVLKGINTLKQEGK